MESVGWIGFLGLMILSKGSAAIMILWFEFVAGHWCYDLSIDMFLICCYNLYFVVGDRELARKLKGPLKRDLILILIISILHLTKKQQ